MLSPFNVTGAVLLSLNVTVLPSTLKLGVVAGITIVPLRLLTLSMLESFFVKVTPPVSLLIVKACSFSSFLKVNVPLSSVVNVVAPPSLSMVTAPVSL